MQPSDSPAPVGRRSGLPSRAAYLDADARSSRGRLCDLAGRERTRSARRVGEWYRVSVAPDVVEEERGPPR